MKKRHYLTQEDLSKIRTLIEVEKLQQKKVAEIVGVHLGTIEKVCKSLQLKTQRSGPRLGEGHPKWKGGRTKAKGYWYVYIPEHPYPRRGTHYVSEHRWIMEQKLGRYLRPSEVVHHIDGNPENNSEENLIVFQTNSKHLKEELKGKIPAWTSEGLEKIRKGVERRANLYRTRPDGSQHKIKKYHPGKKSGSIDANQVS